MIFIWVYHFLISWWGFGLLYFSHIMSNNVFNICVQVSMWTYSYTVEKLHVPNCFPKQKHHFTLPQVIWDSSKFFTSSPTCVLSVFFITAILLSGKWYLIMILIHVSLITNDVHPFMCALPLCLFECMKYFMNKNFKNLQQSL